jgi:hypothetical protein
VFHAAVHGGGVRYDLVAGPTLYVADKTNAATVFFIGGIV